VVLITQIMKKDLLEKLALSFPYDLKNLMAVNEGYDIIKSSPFGNTMITDFALSAIEAESD